MIRAYRVTYTRPAEGGGKERKSTSLVVDDRCCEGVLAVTDWIESALEKFGDSTGCDQMWCLDWTIESITLIEEKP